MYPLQKYRSTQILLGSIATAIVFTPIAAQSVTIDLGAATDFTSLSNSINTANSNTSNTYNIGINTIDRSLSIDRCYLLDIL